MTCDEVQDLLPGYALEALDADEMDEIDAHLMECREHDEDLVELRATQMAMALLDESTRTPTHLRTRVLAAAGPTPLPLAPIDDLDEPFEDEGDLDREPLLLPQPPRRGIPWWAAGGAAAVLAISMFGAGWYVGVRATPPEVQQTVRYSYEMRSPTGQLVQFAGIEGTERVTVTMQRIETAPEGRQYQVWAIRDGKWISLGACNTNGSGWWRGDFQFKLQHGEEVALTVEPSGGSPKPSTPPLIRSRL